MERSRILQDLQQHPEIPVLIIGGGINGVGLLRELALQGIDVLLVDKSDFCAGASAAPSRMIHGGLRYLENGEFRLVQESLRERNLLLKNAPHYVQPLPTTIPIFSWFSGLLSAVQKFLGGSAPPSNRGALLIKAGLTLYDIFARTHRILPPHAFASRASSLRRYPHLHPDIVCTATYYDAWISYPERLGLELVLDAERLHPGARALTYVCCEGGHGDTVFLRDDVSGQRLAVKPRLVVNASGAWIDLVNGSLNRPTHFIGGTKGSHLVIDDEVLWRATGGGMFYYENADGRICILFPLLGKVLAGSTDIKIDDPADAVCDADEVAYILDSIRQVLPGIEVTPEQVVFHFCGVRPLPNSDASTPGQISRDHSCRVIEPSVDLKFPIYSLIGGKWTTFRAFAEEVADRLLAALDQPRRYSSERLPIGGGRALPLTEAARRRWLADMHRSTGLHQDRLRVLMQRYGSRAKEVAFFTIAGTDSPLAHHAGYTRREIEFMVRYERIVHLDDLILRRTTIALLGELTAPLLDELAGILGAALGWLEAETEREIERSRAILCQKHGVHLSVKRET